MVSSGRMAESRAVAAGAVLVVGVVLAACSLTTDLDGFTSAITSGGEGGTGGDGAAGDASGTGDGAAFDAKVTAADAYRAALDVDRPSAHWTFDEPASATGAKDRISGRVSPVRSPLVFGALGAVGGAAKLGDGGAIDVGDLFDLAGVQPYTLEAWIFPDVSASREFFEFMNRRSAPGGYVFYVRKNAELGVQFEHDLPVGGRGASTAIAANTWHHVMVTFDQAVGVRLYVDGKLESTGYADPGNAPRNGGPLLLGGSFAGLLDEVAIYDHALSAAAARLHFESRR